MNTDKKTLNVKIEKLKEVLEVPEVKEDFEIRDVIESKMELLKLELRKEECGLTYGKLVGNYYMYEDIRGTEYLHVKSMAGFDFISDSLLICKWQGEKEIHIYRNAARACSVYVLAKFKKITRDEFTKVCTDACLGMIDEMSEN